MKRSPLRRVSKRKQKQNEEYGKLRKVYMAENPLCKVCQGEGKPNPSRAVDVHHVSGRGSKTNDVTTWLPVCRDCHGKIHFGATTQVPLNSDYYREWADVCEEINVYYGPSWARHFNYLD
jgi:hypothetical protein